MVTGSLITQTPKGRLNTAAGMPELREDAGGPTCAHRAPSLERNLEELG